MTQQTNKVARHKKTIASQANEAADIPLSPDEAVRAAGRSIHLDPSSIPGLGERSACSRQLLIQKTMHRIHHTKGIAARKATADSVVTDITSPLRQSMSSHASRATNA